MRFGVIPNKLSLLGPAFGERGGESSLSARQPYILRSSADFVIPSRQSFPVEDFSQLEKLLDPARSSFFSFFLGGVVESENAFFRIYKLNGRPPGSEMQIDESLSLP